MKLLKILLTAMLVLVIAASVCACSVEVGGEETWNYSAEDKDGALKLFNNFAEKTFADTNQVVTVKSDGKDLLVETIDGTSEYSETAATGAKSYLFIDGDKYISAMDTKESKYYMEGKDAYDSVFRGYKRLLLLSFLDTPDDDSMTFDCKVEGKSNAGKSTETITMTIKKGDKGSASVKAASEDGLIRNISYKVDYSDSESNEKYDLEFTFEYGSAKVEIPDITGWSLVKE